MTYEYMTIEMNDINDISWNQVLQSPTRVSTSSSDVIEVGMPNLAAPKPLAGTSGSNKRPTSLICRRGATRTGEAMCMSTSK